MSCGCEQSQAPILEQPQPWWKDTQVVLAVLSGVLLAAGYVAPDGLASMALYVAALCAGGSTFVPAALSRVLARKLSIGVLMTIAAIGAVALNHVGEAASLAFLFSLAEALEDRAMRQAKRGLHSLLDVMPKTARVIRDGVPVSIEAKDIRFDDLLSLPPGERVATDGVIVEGRSALDMSSVTGESIPVDVVPGDQVFAGAINRSGSLTMRASANGSDNSITHVVELVQAAQAKKGARARMADRIAAPLVPGVLVIALLVAGYGFVVGDPATWIERALVVLVAASPCALAISVPVTVISAIGSASKLGIIIKSGAAFERMGAIQTVAFDKTGTLTRNQPQVGLVHANDADDVLRLAAALEVHSTHPLAKALVAQVDQIPVAGEVFEEPGLGLSGIVDGRHVRVGSTAWLASDSKKAQEMAEMGMTVVGIEVDAILVGLIGIRDELRPQAGESVRHLQAQGIDVVMLTGDNEFTAKALAAQAGISHVRSGQKPADKANAVVELKAAMIGDGINDSPALAAAEVGIAMGASGSQAALECADVAFMGTDLRLLADAFAHAKRARAIMVANIGLSLLIIGALFPLALFAVLGLGGVVLIHELGEVVVIANGIRAAKITRSRRTSQRESS